MDFVPGWSRSSPACSSSKRRSSRRKRSTPAAAAPSELVTPSAALPQLSAAVAPAGLVTPTAASPQLTLAEPPAEPSSVAAEFPAEFSSCPGRRRCRRAAAAGKVRVGASYASTEGPPVTAVLSSAGSVWAGDSTGGTHEAAGEEIC
ncbi:hypothetical protein ATANTOWER_030192 [Ataeniobius toweri]|uniref:Uncharacterized protein n=1 Tax=Ataeniobius toweri TaxID=208326 RepID=A0ABU7AU12_9TELE|nr:hypothetical protein [Ataeniobius toweri]